MSRFVQALLAVCIALACAQNAQAHALDPGYLDLRQLTNDSWQVFWRKPDVQGGPMAIEVRLPQGCSPDAGDDPNFDGAAWVTGWVAVCPMGLGGKNVAIQGLEAQRTDVLLHLQPLKGAASTLRLTPENPSVMLPTDPSSGTVFTSYTALGFAHILEGWDHLLFVFALLLLIRDTWRLVGAITAFTIAHSITLALAALGSISVPAPPVEACIALSIVFLAVEILKTRAGLPRLSQRFPWVVCFSFGLLHGLGFAGALLEIGLPSGDIPVALFAFNVGVELGQLVFVAAVVTVMWAMRRFWRLDMVLVQGSGQPQLTLTVQAYLIGALATFWLVQRMLAF